MRAMPKPDEKPRAKKTSPRTRTAAKKPAAKPKRAAASAAKKTSTAPARKTTKKTTKKSAAASARTTKKTAKKSAAAPARKTAKKPQAAKPLIARKVNVATPPAAVKKPQGPQPERVLVGRLAITGNRVTIGDPSFIGTENEHELKRSSSVPNGVFPVYADLLIERGELRVGRLLLVFDEAKFEDAAQGQFAEPLDHVNVEASMLCFLDTASLEPLRGAVTTQTLLDDLTRSAKEPGRRSARVPSGGDPDQGAQLVACVPPDDNSAYAYYWWYGEDVSTAPHQDIAALGVVTLYELEPWT